MTTTITTVTYWRHKDQENNKRDNGADQAVPYCEPYERIEEIRYGITVYPLQGDGIYAGYEQLATQVDSKYCFQANVLVPPICGHGTTKTEARENWAYEFHKKFQELSAKIDWERTEEEQNLWMIFEDVVDIPAYRRETPVNFRQTGRVIKNSNIPSHRREIEWLDDTTDIVSCEDCPDLLQYKIEQYFRADLLREYQTGKLIKIRSITPSKYKMLSEQEAYDFFDSLPTTKDLPASKIWK